MAKAKTKTTSHALPDFLPGSSWTANSPNETHIVADVRGKLWRVDVMAGTMRLVVFEPPKPA